MTGDKEPDRNWGEDGAEEFSESETSGGVRATGAKKLTVDLWVREWADGMSNIDEG